MKIVHCFFTMKTGGSQILAVDMMNEMASFHEVTLIIVNNQYNDALLNKLDKTIRVHRINRVEGSINPLPLLEFNWLLNKLKPDVIHCHERKLVKLIRYKRAKLVYTIHDVGIPTALFDAYDSLVAISKAVETDVYTRANIATDVIYNGIRLEAFRKRTNYTIPANEPLKIVQVSRLVHEHKGQDVLIKALAALVNHHNVTEVQLDFVGDGVSRQYLTELTDSLGLASKITFLGEKNRDWLNQHIADYHLLVQPSRHEGFGLAVVEGFAAGLPVVASDSEGPTEILTPLPAGYLFRNEDEAACASAILKVREAYRSGTMEAAMHQTSERIAATYSIQATVRQYLNLYERLVTNSVAQLQEQVDYQV